MGERTTTTTACGNHHHLPEDFCIQILVCLPVKSLLRFKSVCKSWLELIQSSFFIYLHTGTTTINSSSKFGTFILQTKEPSYDKFEGDIKLYMLSSGDGDGEDDYGEEEEDDDQKKKMVLKVDDLGFLPFYNDYLLQDSLRMVGSCNGIICLHDTEAMDYHRGSNSRQHYSNLRDVGLWNPATRQFRILPKSIPIEEKQSYFGNWLQDFIAFGFDVETRDYKVLRITPWKKRDEGGCMCRVQVYNLSTDSWRLLEDMDSLPVDPTQNSFSNHGIYLNGSYFFVGTKSFDGICDFVLLSFDFTKEIFTTMQLPDDNRSGVFSYCGEKLAVFTVGNHCAGGYEYYDIWVLNEQHIGVVVNKKSWTKLHSFQIKSRRYPYTEPRCISNNGEFAIISTRTDDVQGRNKLQLFNLITKEVKKDFLIGTKVCRANVYKESLVSILGGNGKIYTLSTDACNRI